MPGQVQFAGGGKGGGEVLEGALQPGEEEVEHGHQGDQESCKMSFFYPNQIFCLKFYPKKTA